MALLRNLLKKMYNKRQSVSIRSEILWVFIVFIIIIMGVSLMIYQQNLNYLRQVDIDHLTESGKQLAASVDSIITDVSGIFHVQYDDLKFRNIVRNKRDKYDERTRFLNTQYVESSIGHIIANSKYIRRCCLFTRNGDVYSNVSSVFQDYKDYIWNIIQTEVLGDGIYYTNPEVWSIGLVDTRVVTAVRPIYDMNGVTPLGYVTLDIDYRALDSLMNAADSQANTLLLYKDVLLYTGGKSRLYGEELSQVCLKAAKMVETGKKQDILNTKGINYLMTAIRSESSGWVVVRYESERELLKDITNRRIRDISILLVTALVVLLVYNYRMHHMIGPLIKMDRVIRGNQGGYLSRVYLTAEEEWQLGGNEIDRVIKGYNDMVDRINDYVKKTLVYEINQKEAQMKMLTYQINPHFLYNTLNTISAMAEIENLDSIVQITDSISNIFRYNLKGDNIVRLSEEMEHVRDYIRIQKYRFPDRFEVNYDIPEELNEMRILKFILQPIVENSISHGLFNKTRGGIIVISAYKEEDSGDLVLQVYDNGEGINVRRLEELNQYLFDARLGKKSAEEIGADGIGMLNVNARITGYYGTDYGLFVESEYGGWTRVMMRLKAES